MHPIARIETSVAAFAGPTISGPIDRPSALLRSLTDFEQVYGASADLAFANGSRSVNFMWHAVHAFFANGGQKLFVARVARPDQRAPIAADYAAAFQRLESVPSIAIVAAPGAAQLDVVQALIAHAEHMRYRFAVIDSGAGQSSAQVQTIRQHLNSPNAAMYYPWITVEGSSKGTQLALPPSGCVAGVYARVDAAQGVQHAPANQPLNLATGLERTVPAAELDALSAQGVNCIRSLAGHGIVVWGARTVSQDPEWRYVNIRRLLLFLEASIERGLQWVVFEPNNEQLWASVTSCVGNFLLQEWQQGALQGSTARDAFFVRCDRTTMTQNDLDNGRLICQVGVAPLKPAEFVIFRIGQWTADHKST
jgi:phage tail sheath protein FI